MKRRQLIRYGGVGLTMVIATGLVPRQRSLAQSLAQSSAQSVTDGVTVQYLGHTCFLFTGDGLKVLVNPYESAGCTAGYTLPDIEPDVVLVSSFLLDEGAVETVEGNPQIITEQGSHQFEGIKFQGFSSPHDRQDGKRFGKNIAWRWTQGGVNILHLGGAAAPLATEDKILLNGADILLAPVGGGVKAYNAQEAAQATKILKPKMVIPTYYQVATTPQANCGLAPVDEFLSLLSDMEVAQVGSDRFEVKKSYLTSEKILVRVLDFTP